MQSLPNGKTQVSNPRRFPITQLSLKSSAPPLLLALVGLVPGTGLFIGVLLAFPAIQMLLGRETPTAYSRRPIDCDPTRRSLGCPSDPAVQAHGGADPTAPANAVFRPRNVLPPALMSRRPGCCRQAVRSGSAAA